jgi:hypothetical protein
MPVGADVAISDGSTGHESVHDTMGDEDVQGHYHAQMRTGIAEAAQHVYGVSAASPTAITIRIQRKNLAACRRVSQLLPPPLRFRPTQHVRRRRVGPVSITIPVLI